MNTHSDPHDGTDQSLIDAVAKGLRLYEEYQRLSIEAETAAGGPCDPPAKVKRRAAEAERVFLTVRETPATSLEGLAAKASLFDALDDPGASGPEYPFGVEGVARSICADLARLSRSPVARRIRAKAAR